MCRQMVRIEQSADDDLRAETWYISVPIIEIIGLEIEIFYWKKIGVRILYLLFLWYRWMKMLVGTAAQCFTFIYMDYGI
jgi:hypothetical protein